MKELWFYMGNLFEDSKKYLKRIKKAQKLPEYRETVRELFAERELSREEEAGRDISFSPEAGA